MENINKYFETLYKNFNERKTDQVIANMTADVKWANGMEGGYVYGHDGVREYWTKQFSMISSNVTPIEIKKEDSEIIVKVYQVVHDLNGKLLSDEVVRHSFRFVNDKIAEFDIEKKQVRDEKTEANGFQENE